MRQHSRQIYRLEALEARFRLTISYIFLTFWTYVENLFKKYINFFINGENKQQLAARLVPFDTFANATKCLLLRPEDTNIIKSLILQMHRMKVTHHPLRAIQQVLFILR